MHRGTTWKALLASLVFLVGCGASESVAPAEPDSDNDSESALSDDEVAFGPNGSKRRVVLFVWDGLRPDSVNSTDTPTLNAIKRFGVDFSDNHSTYPTFTMMNAASFATGGFPGTTGFYGNTLFQRGPVGTGSDGKTLDFSQPVFLEDYGVLKALDAFYDQKLLLVGSLFQAANAAGLSTATVGKTGAAFLQDYKSTGIILDERSAFPLSFAQGLQAAGYPLPRNAVFAYSPDAGLDGGNNPTGADAVARLADKSATDPTADAGSAYSNANQYMMNVFTEFILPRHRPDLSVVWLRNPDATQHDYGPGSNGARVALRAQDQLLRQLISALERNNLLSSTDLMIVSDHAHSTVSGRVDLFPLRAITKSAIGEVDETGYSVSGDTRLADLIARANLGFRAFDGADCSASFVLSGITADGTRVYPKKVERVGGDACVCKTPPCAPKEYVTPQYVLPEQLMPTDVVIAQNGGSDYLYLQSEDRGRVQTLVTFLQSRQEYGAIFVASKYGAIDGTLSMKDLRLESTLQRTPDIIVSYAWDDTVSVGGVRGIEYESMLNRRGMHGSFSPFDVHNTLLAIGPDFKRAFVDPLPTGNVDVAPTIARILRLPLPHADGRVLVEGLRRGPRPAQFEVVVEQLKSPQEASGVSMTLPTSPDATVDATKSGRFSTEVSLKKLRRNGTTSVYFDSAKGIRP